MRLSTARASWLLPALCAAVLLSVAAPATSQYIPFSKDPRNILEGNWQSCLQRDGGYSERVYDHVVNGVGLFEVHLGPKREFAIFKDVQEEHRRHELKDNLLGPTFTVVMEASRANQTWEIPSLNLKFTVTLAGGSRTDCESWFILLEPLKKTS